MHKKIKNIFYLIIFFVFFFLITNYYFSDKNIILMNKSRSTYAFTQNENTINLPLLTNDTKNIIVYKNDLEEFKNKRKKRFWEKLISN
tara:strand:- start:6521 stop:6784 length:264 start_codon:yes stop_codon:yes gene_type:complete